jgi:hypothetical protein
MTGGIAAAAAIAGSGAAGSGSGAGAGSGSTTGALSASVGVTRRAGATELVAARFDAGAAAAAPAAGTLLPAA